MLPLSNSGTRGVPPRPMVILSEYELVEKPEAKGIFRQERGAESLPML